MVLGLWDSWEDGAVIADKASGRYFDPAKLHMLRHKGSHFSVRGPLMLHRSPQGHPVIVHAGQSEDGRELAAQNAEIIFTVQQDRDAGRAFYTDLKQRAARYGRAPDEIKIMPGVMTAIGESRAEAQEKYDELNSLIHPKLGVQLLSAFIGMDVSGYPLDGPLPELPTSNTEHGRQQVIADGRPLSLSRRELAVLTALMERPGVIRSRAEIEDRLYGWQEEVESNAVEVHIHNLRGKIGRDAIETVRGLGYRMRMPS